MKHEVQNSEEIEMERESPEIMRENVLTKFESIHEVATALRDIRIFFITHGYRHLLEGCVDLEERVALECPLTEPSKKKLTTSDHLEPIDTTPALNQD